MSTIRAANTEAVWKLEKFLGLNENPDGDTKLKLGEASVCRNWRITRDLNLQRRPGSLTKYDLDTNAPVMGMWFGNVKGTEVGLAASGGYMWLFYENGYMETPRNLGEIDTTVRVNFFAYSNIVYILNGKEYYSYDGTKFGYVNGYRPLIATSRSPDGSQSTLLEEVNKLNGMRRVWFSPDGESNEFVLPETDLVSIDYVKINATETYVDPTEYIRDRYNGKVIFTDTSTENFTGDGEETEFVLTETLVASVSVKVADVTTSVTLNKAHHKITFASAPAANASIVVTITKAIASGTNTIEIGYQAAATYRTDVIRMTNAELFLGAQDNAVFLYGDGSNKAIYSSIDYLGQPRADYFPDLNEVAVADSNTPITGMIRHYTQMICYKTNSAYSIQFGQITTATGDLEWSFYTKPINRSIGNVALGQVRLVLNSPITLHGNDLYQWVNNSRYSSNLSIDERQAKVISDRIYSTLSRFNFPDCYCYDDNDNQEYYLCYNDEALVYGYAANAWYFYSGITINSLCNIYDDVLFGDNNGKICILDEIYTSDDGRPIDSYWESGSISFGKDYMRKMMSELWVTIKPEAHSFVYVTVQTNKKSEYTEKPISGKLSSFAHMNFADFSFLVNRRPQVEKLKIKAKKFSFMKLIFRTQDLYSSATVLSANPKVRETGYAK